ncbi:hypothetical protein GCM10009853_018980 [Glycomyces scopariae]|uniref:ESAT-6-like protein n=1 Tax=Glycomyces sambucus TaxID=380244 RepID=A0A1G9JS97_9ACTN|nr:WXG100 family type VII secretion target [Glycomyces sambucus]SDL40490.1 WXG100 family type VII secretion target [Glycomyces sambucus]
MAAEMTAETVHQAATDTLTTRQDVDGILAGLKSLIEGLASSWTGAGATAFQGVIEVWNKEAADLLDTLETIANMLDESATASTETDEADASSFAGLL